MPTHGALEVDGADSSAGEISVSIARVLPHFPRREYAGSAASCYIPAPRARHRWKHSMPSRLAVAYRAILAAAIGLGAIAGCSEESATPEPTGAESHEKAAEDKAKAEKKDDGAASPITITVTADKTHAVQPNDEIRIDVTVEGFVLDGAKMGTDAAPGAGHYHVYLGSPDGEPLLVSADPNAVVKVPGDVTDGTHTLRVQLRNHDHSPLDPPVEAKVRLIVYRL